MNLHGVPRAAEAGGSAGAPPCRPSDKRPSEAPLVQSGPSDGVCSLCSAKPLCPLHTLLSKLHLPTEDVQRGTALRGAHVSCPRVERSSSGFEWINKEFGGSGVALAVVLVAVNVKFPISVFQQFGSS